MDISIKAQEKIKNEKSRIHRRVVFVFIVPTALYLSVVIFIPEDCPHYQIIISLCTGFLVGFLMLGGSIWLNFSTKKLIELEDKLDSINEKFSKTTKSIPDELFDMDLALDVAKSDHINMLAMRKEQDRKSLHILQMDGLLLTVILIGFGVFVDLFDSDPTTAQNKLSVATPFLTLSVIAITLSAVIVAIISVFSGISVKDTTLLSFDKDTSMYKHDMKSLTEKYREMSSNIAKHSERQKWFILISMWFLVGGMIVLTVSIMLLFVVSNDMDPSFRYHFLHVFAASLHYFHL